jgi:NADH-quinone oxidoreductase subunit J
MNWVIFSILACLSVGSVVAMILSRNQAHNALFLVLCFACLGGLFGLLQAPFVAAVQVILYAGAIMVLFLFTIAMVDLRGPQPRERRRFIVPAAGALGLVLLAELALVLVKAFRGPIPAEAAAASGSTPADLGHLLLTRYLYPFEITSLLLVAALVGALALAGRRGTP